MFWTVFSIQNVPDLMVFPQHGTFVFRVPSCMCSHRKSKMILALFFLLPRSGSTGSASKSLRMAEKSSEPTPIVNRWVEDQSFREFEISDTPSGDQVQISDTLVQISKSYATVAHHIANKIVAGTRLGGQRSVLTAANDPRVINLELEDTISTEEKSSFQRQRSEMNSQYSNYMVLATPSSSEERENVKSGSDMEPGQTPNMTSDATAPRATPIGIKFWPKCCSRGEILYVPSSPLPPVCELLEGAQLPAPSILQGFGPSWRWPVSDRISFVFYPPENSRIYQYICASIVGKTPRRCRCACANFLQSMYT